MLLRVVKAFSRIALSTVVASALTLVLFFLVLAGMDLFARTGNLGHLKQSARIARYELAPTSPAAAAPAGLLEQAQRFATTVSIEEIEGNSYLVVVGVRDTAGVRMALTAHGYTLGHVTVGYDLLSAGATVLGSFRLFGTLLFLQFVCFATVGGWWIKRNRSAVSQEFSPGRELLLGVAAGVTGAALGAGIQYVQNLFGATVTEQPWVHEALRSTPSNVLLFSALIVLCGPIAEEIFFRGYAFQLLAERVNTTVAYLGSTALFAGIHFNPSASATYILYGLLLAYLFRRTGRLASPIAAHATINTIAVVSHFV